MVDTGLIRISTKARVELVDVTDEIAELVRNSNISSGIALVHSAHTTSAVIVNENEPGLVEDVTQQVQRILDWRAEYRHNRIDHNAPSHITGAFLGPSVALPIAQGKLDLGTWQSVFFVELDGPRSRRLTVVTIGE